MIRRVMPWQATGPGDITVLRAPGRRLTKRITETGVEDYDRAGVFSVAAVRVDEIEDIAELLDVLAAKSDRCIIRGALKPEFASHREVPRRLHDRPDEPAQFVEVPRQWVMIDLEHVPCPPGIDPTDPVLVGGAIRQGLPTEFRSARCVAQLSSQAGLAEGLRAHCWFLLDRPMARAELKAWLGDVPGLDISVFGAVQPHYVARPIFAGVDDPCAERLALLPGYAEVEVPYLPPRQRQAFSPAEAKEWSPPARGPDFRATRPEQYMLGCLRALVGAPSGKGRDRCMQVALTLFGLCKAGLLDPAEVTGRLKGIMRDRGWAADEQTRGDTLADVNRALEWAWDHAQPRTLP